MFEAATFTNGAIQTPPTLLQDDLGDPDIDAMRMVTFAALRASDQTAFEVGAYKERSILVQKIPKIATRCRFSATIVKLEFRIFCEKSRQNERSSALCSLVCHLVSFKIEHYLYLIPLCSA